MSADSYSICPKCLEEKRAALRVSVPILEDKAEKAYGVETPTEWSKLCDEAKAQRAEFARLEKGDADDLETFREYYETYLTYDPPTLNFRYDASLHTCGFEHHCRVENPIQVTA